MTPSANSPGLTAPATGVRISGTGDGGSGRIVGNPASGGAGVAICAVGALMGKSAVATPVAPGAGVFEPTD
ncbi:MAG TPA: hypothetical protein VIC55_11235 [Gemmatimonadaceae bacterium]